MNDLVKQEIVKRLKVQLCDVNRELRHFSGNMETDQRFAELVSKRAELKERINTFK
jgi:DNA-directed RNA polymerase delta subunit